MKVIELKQTRQALKDQLAALMKKDNYDQRDYDVLADQIRGLDHEILDGETVEAREAEAAKRAYHAGRGVIFGGGADYEVGQVLRPDQSVREYMQRSGLIRQKEYEDVTMGHLLKGMITPSRDPSVRAALAGGADATGGFSVPDITLSRFIDHLRAAIVCMRAGAATVPLISDKTTIARTATDPTAAWRAEAGAVAESEPTFEGVVFVPRSLAVLVKASREVIEDSVNIEQALEQAFIGALSVELDRVALNGSGTPPEPKGISNTTGVGSVAGGGALTSYDKVLDALYEILVDNGPMPTAMVMPPRTTIALAKLKESTSNAPLAMPPLLANIPSFTTTSMPITESPGTASKIILGDFTQLYFGIRTELRIEVLRELYAGNLQLGYIAHLRADIGVAHPESFAMVTGIVP